MFIQAEKFYGGYSVLLFESEIFPTGSCFECFIPAGGTASGGETDQ